MHLFFLIQTVCILLFYSRFQRTFFPIFLKSYKALAFRGLACFWAEMTQNRKHYRWVGCCISSQVLTSPAGPQMCSGQRVSKCACFCLLTDKYSSNKRQRLAQDFLGSIDQTGEFLSLVEEEEVDEVKQERLEVSRRLLEMCFSLNSLSSHTSEGGRHWNSRGLSCGHRKRGIGLFFYDKDCQTN